MATRKGKGTAMADSVRELPWPPGSEAPFGGLAAMGPSGGQALAPRFFDPKSFLAAGQEVKAFQEMVLGYFRTNERHFPWRDTHDPWAILVSEVMLQQTQTERVVPKYLAFLEAFPVPAALAEAPIDRLMGLWQGLGYNRRALALKRAASRIASDFCGRVPDSEAALTSLDGVGPYTSRAVMAFAFGQPVVFIETNIRSVFLWHFFPEGEAVPDSRLEGVVAASLVAEDPRTWYYALMDYGVYMKRRWGNPNSRSAHYARQSPFANSHRRVRGAVLREIGLSPGGSGLSRDELHSRISFARERVDLAADELLAEGFLAERSGLLAFPAG